MSGTRIPAIPWRSVRTSRREFRMERKDCEDDCTPLHASYPPHTSTALERALSRRPEPGEWPDIAHMGLVDTG